MLFHYMHRMAVSEILGFYICKPNGYGIMWCSQVNTSSKFGKWEYLWSPVHRKMPSSGGLGPKCIVSNQSAQQIPPKHWKLALALERSACWLDLVLHQHASTYINHYLFLFSVSCPLPRQEFEMVFLVSKMGWFYCVYSQGFGRVWMLNWNVI